MQLPLNEHEGPSEERDANPGVYTPTQEERALLKKVERLFQKAKKGRARFDFAWTDYYKLFRGHQWKEQRPSYRASEVFNLIWQVIQSQVPIITDAKPRFEFLPSEPSDREFADLMNDIALADWQRHNWLMVLTAVVYDAHLYGTGFSSLKYDTKKDELSYKSVDPFYIFPDPEAEDFYTKCSYLVHAEPEDLAKMKRIFKDKAEYIKSDVIDFDSTERIDLSQHRYNNPTSNQLYVETTGGYDNKQPDEVLVKTYYLEDDEILEEKDPEDDTKTVHRLKYPNGRRVITCNEIILDDGEVGYEGDDIFPYQRLVNNMMPRQFFGISDLEALAGPQRVFNKLVSYVLDVLYLTGNPIWVVDSTSGIDTNNLTNQPGLVVEKEPGSEVRREAGVQLQPYILSLIDRLKEWFEQFSGSQDITRGTAPGGVTAASAIADLQNAAQTRIRQKMRYLDAYLQDFGQQYTSRVMQFYTAPRVFRLTNKDGSNKYFKMHMEKNGDGYTAKVNRYTENGLLAPMTEEYQLRGKLDVRVTTGSSLPFSKTENERQSLALYDRQIIDAEEVLKRIEYPNYEAILGRMEEKAAQQAQAQAQAPGQ